MATQLQKDIQAGLDELFPEGAWVTQIDIRGDRELPTGIDMAVGRVFCSGTRHREDGTREFELFFDERPPDADPNAWFQPFRVWVVALDDSEYPMVEARVVDDDPNDDVIRVVRLWASPHGPRKPAPGQREFITKLREEVLLG